MILALVVLLFGFGVSFGTALFTLAYAGVFGVTLWRAARFPFLWTGIILCNVGGMPLFKEQEKTEPETKEAVELKEKPDQQATHEADDDYGSQPRWRINGLTPAQAMQQFHNSIEGGSLEIGTEDGDESRESTGEWKARKSLERLSA